MDTLANTVACRVCMAEVPESEAKSVEATDYVAHFCGLDCYQQWRSAAAEELAAADADKGAAKLPE